VAVPGEDAMSAFSGLEKACPRCERLAGDHTLREWQACAGADRLELPYVDQPEALQVMRQVRESFGLGDDVIVVDHVVARALVLAGSAGPVRSVHPGVLCEFQVGIMGQAPTTITKVLFVGDERSIRGFGRLLRDASNGAVNAAGRAVRDG
jgi:hypothetical protein